MGVLWSIVFFFSKSMKNKILIFLNFKYFNIFLTLLLVSADSPEQHRYINEAEKKYILKETEKTIALRKFCAKVSQ